MPRLFPVMLLASLVTALAAAADEPPAPAPPAPRPMSIVYLLDASRSMTDKLPVLRAELLKAIDTLKPVQVFNVVVITRGKTQLLSADLLSGSPDNKRKAAELVDHTTPAGDADPLGGLRAAFAAKPSIVFFITDAAFPDADRVLKEVRTLNQERRTRVVTISGRPLPDGAAKLLKQIADENGGIFKQFPKLEGER